MAPTKRKSQSPSKKPPAKRNTSTATPDKTSTASAAAGDDDADDRVGGDHTIAKLQMTEKGARGHRDCKLCRIGETRLGKNGKTKRYSCCYECTTCQAGFHIECFIVYHNIDNYPEVKKHLGAKKVAEIKESLKRNDKCKFVKDSKFSSDCGLQLRFMV